MNAVDKTQIEFFVESIERKGDIDVRAGPLKEALRAMTEMWPEYAESIKETRLIESIGNPRDLSRQKIQACWIEMLKVVHAKIGITKSISQNIDEPVLNWFFPTNLELTSREKLEITVFPPMMFQTRVEALLAELKLGKDQIQTTIDDQKDRIKNLGEELDRHAAQAKQLSSKYNFVGLTHAFEAMEVSAVKEKWILTAGMIGLGVLALAPLIVYLIFLGWKYYQSAWGAFDWERLIIFGPIIISVEIIIIYFFRVLLKQQQSTKAQILQLRLRQGVCAFIEKYVEFSRKNQSIPLEKFESLIFSGLTPDPEKVPSTFDGLDSIAQLIRAAKGSRDL